MDFFGLNSCFSSLVLDSSMDEIIKLRQIELAMYHIKTDRLLVSEGLQVLNKNVKKKIRKKIIVQHKMLIIDFNFKH